VRRNSKLCGRGIGDKQNKNVSEEMTRQKTLLPCNAGRMQCFCSLAVVASGGARGPAERLRLLWVSLLAALHYGAALSHTAQNKK
jgi:hypothetical protein